MKKHVCEEGAHHTAVARREAFLHTQRGGAPNICQELHSQRAEQVRRNRNIFKCITEVLRSYDGEQNIAIRGHQDEDGNFMAMLSLFAKENSVLRDHLENAPRISKYTCPDIQNIIFFSAKQILDGIIDNCRICHLCINC